MLFLSTSHNIDSDNCVAICQAYGRRRRGDTLGGFNAIQCNINRLLIKSEQNQEVPMIHSLLDSS